jgi:hypothetical protein
MTDPIPSLLPAVALHRMVPPRRRRGAARGRAPPADDSAFSPAASLIENAGRNNVRDLIDSAFRRAIQRRRGALQ